MNRSFLLVLFSLAVTTTAMSNFADTTVVKRSYYTQRLQSAAPPNAVMLSARTFARLPFAITRTLEPLEISVKGKRDPVQCYLWTVHSDRRLPDKRVVLRESLLTASRRTTLSDRLRQSEESSENG